MGNLLYEQLTYKIRGALFEVYNRLGFGHKEGVYQKALAIEFEKQGIQFVEQKSVPVTYLEQKVGIYRPDFVVEDKVIIELKSLSYMGKEAESQIVYYLKGSGYELGLLVNFGASRLEIIRKIWSRDPRKSVLSAVF